MFTIPVKFYSARVIEQENFTFTCRYCERDGLHGDFAMINNSRLNRYENLCITCAEEMRAIAHEDMKAIRQAVAEINA